MSAFLMRNWQAALGLLAVAFLSTLLAIRTDQRDDARAALARERAEHVLFAERVRARAERIRADFISYARRVERAQDQISQEVSRDYQARLSDLHRRVFALRLQLERGRAHPGGAGRPGLPGLPGAAGGSDAAAGEAGLPAAGSGAGLAFEDAILATEQALRLEALQRWVRRQQAVERGAAGRRAPVGPEPSPPPLH